MGEPTIISIEQYGKKVTFEIPYSDTSLSEMLHALVGCLVALTWNEDSILEAMKGFAEEHLP